MCNQRGALGGQPPARPAARARAVVDQPAGFIAPHQIERRLARAGTVCPDAALARLARDRGGRSPRADVGAEELAQVGRDAVIDRQDAPSFLWLSMRGILGRKGRFGKSGFAIILDYGKSAFHVTE